MDWKQSFDRNTLNAGWQLWRTGRVGRIFRDGDIYMASVMGTCLVQAQIEDGAVINLTCSCPKGRRGELCMHEAAFLFALENEPDLAAVPEAGECAGRLNKKNEYQPSSSQRNLMADSLRPESQEKSSPAKPSASTTERLRSTGNPLLDLLQRFEQENNAAKISPQDSREEQIQKQIAEVRRRKALQQQMMEQQARQEELLKKQQEEQPQPEAEPGTVPEADSAPDEKQTSPKPVDAGFETFVIPDEPENKPETQLQEESDQTALESAPAADDAGDHSAPAKKEASSQNEKSAPEQIHAENRQEESSVIFSFGSLVDSLQEDELKSLIKDYALLNPDLKDFILARHASDEEEMVLDLLLEEAQTKLRECFGLDEFVSYRESVRALRELNRWISTQTSELVQSGHPFTAFAFLQNLLNLAEELSQPQDEAQMESVSGQIFSLLDWLLDRLEPEEMAEVFSWAEGHLEKKDLPALEDQLIRLVESGAFNLPSLSEQKLNALMNALRENLEQKTTWNKNQSLIAAILELMDEQPLRAAQVKAFEKEFGRHPQVLYEKAKLAREEGELEEAQNLLLQVRQCEMTPAQNARVTRALAELYAKQDKRDKAAQELRDLIFVQGKAWPSDVLNLKELDAADDWQRDLESLEKEDWPDLLKPVYEDLNMDDKLLDLLEKSPDLEVLARTEDRLSKVDPARTGSLWLEGAKKEAETAREREQYRRVSHCLQKALHCPGMESKARDLADQIKADNHRRHAFLEELEKAGF